MWSKIVYGKKDMPYNYSEFICDTVDDIANLPTNVKLKGNGVETCSVGSKALVTDEKKLYVLNNNNVWKLLKDYTSSSSGGADIDVATVEETSGYLEI